MHYLMVDDFYPKAKSLRQVFDRKFAQPLHAHGERFVWDFWHVPGEYTHLRTPAVHYFPKKQYEAFHRYLVKWGREHLGCHDISPPWLSCYIAGCKQQPHRDHPHGPLAFVFSLSQGGFKGGQTFLQKPKTLIAPKFNRLTLFNPSLQHGVKEVKGTMDPRQGRLVIHGWFVQPRPFWVGPLKVSDVARGLNEGLEDLPTGLGAGLLSLRLQITQQGAVSSQKILINTLVGGRPAQLAKLLQRTALIKFAQSTASSRLTLPLILT